MATVRTAEYDEAIFLDVARSIQRVGVPLRSIGAGAVFLDHTPLYLYLLSLFASPTAGGIFFARSVTVLAALAALALTYRFGLRLGGRPVGLLAALLLGISPFFLVYAFFVRMEMFMLLAILAGLYLVVVGLETDSGWRLLLAGLAFALAVLFKEFALAAAGVAAAFVAWERRRTPRRALSGAVLVGAPALLALGAWAALSWKLSPTVFAATMKRWIDSAVSPVASEPRVGLSWRVWAGQVGAQLLSPGLVAGLLLGLGGLVLERNRTPRGLRLLWAYMLVAVGLSFLTSLKEPRHLIGVLPAAALIAAHMLVRIWNASRSSGRAVGSAAAVAAFVVVFAFAGVVRPPLLPRMPGLAMPWVAPVYAERLANEQFYGSLAQAGRQVAATTAPGELVTVVHQATVVAYYADRPYAMLYTQPFSRVTALVDQASVVVWDEATFLRLKPDEIDRIRASVAEDFELAELVRDANRSVAIYRRKVKP